MQPLLPRTEGVLNRLSTRPWTNTVVFSEKTSWDCRELLPLVSTPLIKVIKRDGYYFHVTTARQRTSLGIVTLKNSERLEQRSWKRGDR